MFRKLLTIGFIVSISIQANLSWGQDHTFRNTRWGMTPEAVIASESKMDPIEKNENSVKYNTHILGKNVELIYRFAQNKLIGSSYKLNDNYLNSINFIATYQKFKEALAQKYGPALKEKTNWLNDTYRHQGSKRGLALSLGHVEYLASWETPATQINCSLKEENYNVQCLVEYWSKEFSGLQEEPQNEDKLDPL